MATNTSNFSFIKPAVASPLDADKWGGQLNSNWDSIDSILKVARDMEVDSVQSSSPVTVTTSDRNTLIPVDASGGAITVDLPAAATAGDGFLLAIKKVDSSSNNVTIDPNGSETIDGASDLDLENENETAFFVSDGTNWRIISRANQPVTVPDASESIKGILELATQSETNTGTDDTRAVTPLKLANIIFPEVDVQIFTASGTWNKPTNMKSTDYTWVRLIGAGAAGYGGTAANNGGASSFGAHLTANGGLGSSTGTSASGGSSTSDLGADGQDTTNNGLGGANGFAGSQTTGTAAQNDATRRGYGGGAQSSGEAGGGGGAYEEAFIQGSSLGSTESVTIGAGGVTNGNPGNRDGADGYCIAITFVNR